jgi:hypothetical protein
MATVAFTAAVAGEGAGAYFVMAVMGSMVDNLLVMPTLFPPDAVEGSKLGEVNISGADEGDPVPMVFGQYAVVGGQYVWVSESFTETANTKRVGKSGSQTSYQYDTIAANAICYLGEKWSPGTIDTLDQVFFNEKRVYVNAATTPPTNISAAGMMVIHAWSGSGFWICFDTEINATIKEDVWAKFDSGDTIDISGFTNAANNDSSDRIIDKVEELVIPSYGVSSRTLPAWRMQLGKVEESDTQSNGLGSDRQVGIAGTVTIDGVANSGWADGLWVGQDPQVRKGDQVSNYQPYEDEVGEANAPAWSDCAFMPFSRLILNEFGGRLPSVRYVVSADSSLRDTRGIIGHILLQAGLDASEYDVTGVDNTATILGFALAGPVEVAKALQPLMLAQDVIAQERGGTIYFKDRADNIADTTSILDDFVGAAAGEQIAGGRVKVSEMPTEEMPAEVEVTFTDFNDGNLGRGMARAHLLSDDSSERYDTNERRNKVSLNFAMTLTEDDAREIAWRILTEANANTLRFNFTLPPRYIWLQENDRVNITTGGSTYPALIRKVDIGANMLMQIEAHLDIAVEQDYSDWAV